MRRRRNEDDWEPEGRGVGSDDGREAAGNCWRGLAGWEAYFGSHRSSDGEDGKKRIVERLQTFFAAAGRKFISGLEECTLSFPLNYTEFASECPLKGISRAIAEAPEDALSCIGLAVARSLEEDWIRRRGASVERKVSRENRIWPRLIGYGKVTKLKDLNSTTVGNFVTIQGNVVRVSNVRQQITSMLFMCGKCGKEFLQEFQDFKYFSPLSCPDAPKCRGRLFQPKRPSAVTRDWQKLRIQETDNDDVREVGRIPRTIDVELVGDLIDTTIPGDLVHVCGIVKTINVEAGDNVGSRGQKVKTRSLFHLYIDANSIEGIGKSKQKSGREDSGEEEFTEADYQAFEEIGRDMDPFALLVHSLCPTIFGHELVKAGLLLTLLGGSHKHGTKDVHIRPDPHCLLVGDPGLGKSQLLKAVTNVATRGVYVCGNTSTTAGLTVTMVKEQGSNDFSLEAGALVLGDQGICCIDEFDKMGAEHQALLEAMEQQTVSIAKAGMLCNLSARTSVIAAANPKGGHYDKSKTVCENLKIALPLLSRFDLVFIILDRPDEKRDRVISDHVIESFSKKKRQHKASRNAGDVGNGGRPSSKDVSGEQRRSLEARLETYACFDPLPTQLLRKYISYARTHLNPVLSDGAKRVLQKFYLTLRKGVGQQALDVTPVTTRLLESLIRLVEARARAEHRLIATENDALDVIEVMKASMMDTFSDEYGRIDLSRASGMSRSRDTKRFVMALHTEAERSGRDMFTMTELRRVAQNIQLKIPLFEDFIDMINQQNFLLKRNKCYQLQGTTFSGT